MSSKAPKDLSARAQSLWDATTGKFELRDDELRVLEDACREAALIDTMESTIATMSLMSLGSMGQPVVNPLVSEIRQHRTVLAALLRSLKLPDDSGEAKVNQNRAAGAASWASRRGA